MPFCVASAKDHLRSGLVNHLSTGLILCFTSMSCIVHSLFVNPGRRPPQLKSSRNQTYVLVPQLCRDPRQWRTRIILHCLPIVRQSAVVCARQWIAHVSCQVLQFRQFNLAAKIRYCMPLYESALISGLCVSLCSLSLSSEICADFLKNQPM